MASDSLQLTVWSLPSLVAMLLSAHTAFGLRSSRDVPGSTALVALCGCVFLWSLGQLLGTLTTTLDLKIAASKLQYPGISLLPLAWLAFALTYVRRVHRFRPTTVAAALVIPVTTIGLAATNEVHQLIWRDVRLEPAAGFIGMALDHGPWFLVHLIYSYAMVGAGTLLLAYELSASPRHRLALGALVLAPAVVAMLNLVHLSGISPLTFIDPTPLGFSLGALLLVHGVLHSGLLQLWPALHRQLLEQIDDAVIVLDARGRIVDLNAAGRRLLVPDADASSVEGASIEDFLPGQTLTRLISNAQCSLEIEVDLRTYHVRATPMYPDRDAPATVLVFRDITRRSQPCCWILTASSWSMTVTATKPAIGYCAKSPE